MFEKLFDYVPGPPFVLKILILLRFDKDGRTEKLKLRDAMIHKWYNAGMLLDLSAPRLYGIFTYRLGDVRQCCLDVLQEWINCGGSSNYPATWDGLLKLLRDLDLHPCAESLQAALMCISS